ncbi:siroheme synthase CysG [Roseiterribacter gracilis]|uniref:uroporphyrinogen-III C-methyltransferase n=1 Tax=Roseiterribacter gracilis TaxID=2812848 RepID=A0A8S8XCY9_9PROT|nr:siroheme synthase [Rhodospirillales bacterium TMPK1]
MNALPEFPIFLRTATALVVGDGPDATAKVALLRSAGLDVTQHADTRDFAGFRLVVLACEQPERYLAPARAAGALVNVVDRPDLCDWTMPAIVTRGAVTVAIGSGGTAPALARDLRARVEAAIPPAYAKLADWCSKQRDLVRRRVHGRDARRRLWQDVLDGAETRAVLAGDSLRADALLARRLAGNPSPRGEVALVGAGPGDPTLLTLVARHAIERADVILHDALVSDAVLNLARREAVRISVGKRCGRHSASQAAINRLLVAQARKGLRVVRLKGGDPLLFGRAAEELDALAAAGFPVQIVPGITAVSAAAARLQMPLTHRGVARGLTLVTGHGKDGPALDHDWDALANCDATLAVYMGARGIGRIAAKLIEAGRAPSTPVVAIENATRDGERSITATLADIADRLGETDGPVLIVIGEVVALAAERATMARAAA